MQGTTASGQIIEESKEDSRKVNAEDGTKIIPLIDMNMYLDYPNHKEGWYKQIFVGSLKEEDRKKSFRSRPQLPSFFHLWYEGDYAYFHKASSEVFLNYYHPEVGSVDIKSIWKNIVTFFVTAWAFVAKELKIAYDWLKKHCSCIFNCFRAVNK